MLEYGNVGMMDDLKTGYGRGTRLRALDEQMLVPPEGTFFHHSKIPLFQYSSSHGLSPTKDRVNSLR